MQLNANQLAELRAAQKQCFERWGHIGMARVMQDGSKEIGTLILPEIHQRINATFTVVRGYRVIASGITWKEVFTKAELMCPKDKCEFDNTGVCVKCGSHRPASAR